MKRTSKTKTNLFISNFLSPIRGLLELADTAAALHHVELLPQTAHSLSRLGLDEAGVFYQALADGRTQANVARSRGVLRDLADFASPWIRAKALVAWGTNEFEKGDWRTAETLYRDSMKVCPASPLIALHVQEMTAQIASANGDHKRALKLLIESLPLAHGIHRLNHFNSLAVESACTGNLTASRAFLAPCLASPYHVYYPEWTATAQEIYHSPRHRIYNPLSEPDRMSRVVTFPVRALMDNVKDFKAWHKKDEPAKSTHYEITLANRILEGGLSVEESDFIDTMRELVKRTHPSFETLEDIASYAENKIREGNVPCQPE